MRKFATTVTAGMEDEPVSTLAKHMTHSRDTHRWYYEATHSHAKAVEAHDIISESVYGK